MDYTNIIPVLIGADLNCYNIARAFHEKYGIKSHAFGRYEIGPTKNSKIVEFHTISNLDNPLILVEVLDNFAAKNPEETMILLGCTDDYASMIIENKEALEKNYIVPYIEKELRDSLVSKADFYRMCEKHNIPYPKTLILNREFENSIFDTENLSFSYPIIIKPSSSIEYWKHPFNGMKKVYTAENPSEAVKICKEIFGSGYSNELIIQDFIPGDDSGMNVLTAYSDKNCKVKMMCLGHVLLEEHTPKGLGNHAVIITKYMPEITTPIITLLDDLGYRGFSNFDIKYDPRDGKYKAFEINLRLGRSNFYITNAGINVAELIINDYIKNDQLQFHECTNKKLWRAVPVSVIKKYVKNETYRNEALELIKNKKSGTSLWYKYDIIGNPKRFFWVAGHMLNHITKYKKYCK